jgi:hypothetical protein
LHKDLEVLIEEQEWLKRGYEGGEAERKLGRLGEYYKYH